MMNKAETETEKLIERLIRQFHMIDQGDVVIAGVSGGADSVCLLLALCELREKLGFEVKVCHVNHCLRGAEADADEEYVRSLCTKLNVESRIFRKDVELIAKKRKQSCEEAGREVRREAFEQMCEENGGTKVATAHHRDDNAETILLNLARGTGIRGLCGIVPVRGKMIRPLLSLTRVEIEAYLREKNVRWCSDATNDEDDYTRNRIRHNILPAMEQQINERTVKHLEALSRQAEEVCEYLDYGVEQAWNRCVGGTVQAKVCVEESSERSSAKRRFSMLEIDKEKYLSEFPAVRKLLLQKCIAEIRGGQKDLTSVHIQSVSELFDKQVGKMIDLPGGVIAKRTYTGITILSADSDETKPSEPKKTTDADSDEAKPGEPKKTTDADSDEAKQDLSYKTADVAPDERSADGLSLRFVENGEVSQAEEIPQKSYTKWIDYDIIKCGLCVRTRQSGDYLVIDEQGRRQKLKSWFINMKIPKEERDRMLLVADSSHIVWIPGYRMSRAYKVTEKTRHIVEIKVDCLEQIKAARQKDNEHD